MDPFALALDALFSAPGSRAAVYDPVDGDLASIRVIIGQQPNEFAGTQGGQRVMANVLQVRRSEVEQPVVGDRVFVDDGTPSFPSLYEDAPCFAVLPGSDPSLDIEGLTWTCEIERVEVARELTVLKYTRATDGFGDAAATFSPTVTVPVQMRRVRGSEDEAGTLTVSRGTKRFLIDWSDEVSDLNPKDRVEYDGQTYSIDAVTEVDDRVGLEIVASARDDQ